MTELDERMKTVGTRLVEVIGYDQLTAVVQGFTAAYAEACARKEAGEELPEQVRLRIPVDLSEYDDPEVGDLLGQFVSLLLESAIRHLAASQN